MINTGMLGNYHILDLTDEKGQLCAKLLADMGAEVVRIEKPGSTVSPVYANTGKHLISLNIDHPKGRDLFQRLIQKFDVIVESFDPGYLTSLGLDYSELTKLNPGLIMASIAGFGQSGPYRDYKTSDLVAGAMGGGVYVSGEPDKEPLKPFGSQAYSTACLFAASGILLALWDRHTSGKGQYLDISIQESVASTLDHVLPRYFYTGEIARRTGNLYWNQSFRIFPCRDGHILLSLLQNWDTLVEWLDSEGMAGDLKDIQWQDESFRRNHIEHIIEILEKWTLLHAADELVELGQLMRFPWAKVDSIPEVVENPQLNDRGYFVETLDPVSGKKYPFPGAPVRMSHPPWQAHPDLPGIGEFNFEIYRNRLTLSESEVQNLAREGVI